GRPNAMQSAPNVAGVRAVTESGPQDASGIVAILAQEIHSRVLAEGSMLPSERQLCDRFGVGRSIIREVVKQLEVMGLLELRKGHRPRIVYPSLSRLLGSISDASRLIFSGTEGGAHMEQARLFLEIGLVRYAAQSATPAQIGKMV